MRMTDERLAENWKQHYRSRVMAKYVGTPRDHRDQYPWRPMDNREKLARWSLAYYCEYLRGRHPMKGKR